MGSLLQLVGMIWAILGIANIIGMPWTSVAPDSPLLTWGLMFNGLLFVLPGLALLGIGTSIARKKSRSAEPVAPPTSIQERLARLESLRTDNLITPAEYDSKRGEILKDT